MAYKVSREKRTIQDTRNRGQETWLHDEVVIGIIADTYSELITGIDELPDADLTWSGHGKLGIEGMPNKMNGKWVASLKTPPENTRRVRQN